MTVLEDFGYRKLRAEGTRPLLVLLVAGPENPRRMLVDGSHVLHEEEYYDELIFDRVQRGIFIRLVEENVIGYYRSVSNGRFGWSRAIPPHQTPIRLTADEAALDLPQRFALIQQKAAALGFDFSALDASHDSAISATELGMLVMDNFSTVAATTLGVNGTVEAAPGTPPMSIHARGSVAGGRASFTTLCHELSHQLGTVDLYGKTGLNQDCTLMGATEVSDFDDRRTFYLDAWHRMMLGWIEPQIVEMSAPSAFRLAAAATAAPAEVAALLHDPSHGTSEYFVLEYRTPNPVGGNHYDSNVASEGLAIWHVILGANRMPMELPSLADPTGTDKSVWLEGPDGNGNFARGGNQLWREGTTPELRWLDGTPTGARLHIQPFGAGAPSISVDVVRDDPRFTHVIDTEPKFHGIVR